MSEAFNQAGNVEAAIGGAVGDIAQVAGKFAAKAKAAEERLAQSKAINSANSAARDAKRAAITSADAAPDGSTYDGDFDVSYNNAKDEFLKDLSGSERDNAAAAWDAEGNRSKNTLLKASLVKRATFIEKRYEEETNTMSNAVNDDPNLFGEKLDQLNNNLYNDDAREDFGDQFETRKKADTEKLVNGYMSGFLERKDYKGAREALKDKRVSATMDPDERKKMTDRIRGQENQQRQLEWNLDAKAELKDKKDKKQQEVNAASDAYNALSNAETEADRQTVLDNLQKKMDAGIVAPNVFNSAVNFENKAQIKQEAPFVDDIMGSIFDESPEVASKKIQEHFDNNKITPETRRKLESQVRIKQKSERDTLLSRKITAAKTAINDDFRLHGLNKALDIDGSKKRSSDKLKNEANLRMLEIISENQNVSVREAKRQAVSETLQKQGVTDFSALPMNKLPENLPDLRKARVDLNKSYLRKNNGNPTRQDTIEYERQMDQLNELEVKIRNQKSEKK